MPFDPTTLALLVLAAFVAGFVDSIAGGGGLITLPALLLAGIPPVQAVATNKLQSTFGSAMASYRFWKSGLIDTAALMPSVAAAFIGAGFGALMLNWIDARVLARIMPFLLIAVALYFAFGPKASEHEQKARLSKQAFALGIAAPIGFYDGLFGPGTGSFFAIGFVTLAGLPLLKATANTKLLNFASNAGSLLVFIAAGQVIWTIGLAMAVGQTAGAQAGASAAITHGSKLIRPLIVVVCCALAVRLLLRG